jgi:uncharacterized protein (TIRG00374 family)
LLQKKRLKTKWTTVAGYVVAMCALVWVFHGIKIDVLRKDFASINWALAIFGMFVDVGRYAMQSVRWKLLLTPVCRIPVFSAFRALYAGVFLNMLFPLRIGEFTRAYIVSHRASVRFSSVVSSLIVEYLFDGIWLALGIGLVAVFTPLPKEILGAARVLGIVILMASMGFAVIIFHKERTADAQPAEKKGLLWKTLRQGVSFLLRVRKSLKIISRSRLFFPSFCLSALDTLFHITAFWIILHAYGLPLSYLVSAAVLLFIFVGVIIPNAPSNVGAFQFLCVLALMGFGVDKTDATGFSILVFVLISLPQLVIGAIAFAFSGETFGTIRNEFRRLRAAP